MFRYEILIRLNEAGVVGAHQVFAANQLHPFTGAPSTLVGDAQPLAVEPGNGLPTLAEALGEGCAVALTHNEALRSQVVALQAERDGLTIKVDELSQQLCDGQLALDQVRQALEDARIQLGTLTAQLNVEVARSAALQAQLQSAD
ncbi:hypothetical protein [Chitinimonas koreensis]|uniref:hypothetical protein n=1 Tax=Chitinimonas koreensis TaxID=356302 RepID=UPI00040BCC21|nr:hypothetical protein [Chitinimonas koreensis]QNM94888.1 hypothetical protein H9L41_13250 [Chitinimonas koreensis]